MTTDLKLESFVELLAFRGGPDLRGYKLRNLKRRIDKRMGELQIKSYDRYLDYIAEHPKENRELLNTVLINVTEFYRDPSAWELLRQRILPKLIPRETQREVFRAWCVGCSTGEEAYSLALMLAEHFGPENPQDNIKIYATDIDEDALAFARLGQYPAERIRRVPADLRKRYFTGSNPVKVSREIRRMLIFGKSNIVTDAPISHVKLVLCRNLLIYLNPEAQKAVLQRLHYALDEGGVLFLGKAESQLSQSRDFRLLNSRWRIFQKVNKSNKPSSKGLELDTPFLDMADNENPQLRLELAALKLQQRHLLETLQQGIIILDQKDVVVSNNQASLRLWGLNKARLAGQPLQESELSRVCPVLLQEVKKARSSRDPATAFECKVKANGNERALAVIIRAINTERQDGHGLIIYCDDVTHRQQLQSAVEQLESTSEELQSANEELETTNEELQSTNEELETTNEELQSTNEELETTNEELQSLNEELHNINDQLQERSKDLDRLNARFAATLDLMPWPVIVLDEQQRIQLWNSESEKLFGFTWKTMSNMKLDKMPFPEDLIAAILKGHSQVTQSQQPVRVPARKIRLGSHSYVFDLQFTPIEPEGPSSTVLVTLIHGSEQKQPLPLASKPSVDGKSNSKPANSAKDAGKRR